MPFKVLYREVRNSKVYYGLLHVWILISDGAISLIVWPTVIDTRKGEGVIIELESEMLATGLLFFSIGALCIFLLFEVFFLSVASKD